MAAQSIERKIIIKCNEYNCIYVLCESPVDLLALEEGTTVGKISGVLLGQSI